jgi:hypothetical protein
MPLSQLDVVTVGCLVTSALGLFSLFVSSKPVTVGSVVLIVVLSMSVTQTTMGVARNLAAADDPAPSFPHAVPNTLPANPDVVDQVQMAWKWAVGSVRAHRDEL